MKRKGYLQLTCPGPIPVSRHMPLVLQTRRCCHCKENELQGDNAIGISIKNDYKNNCNLKCIFFPIIQEYISLYIPRLVHIQESFSNSKDGSYSIAGQGVRDLWPFISTERKLFQNQCSLSQERSFDLETSKAPMVLDGGKPKGGGHLTLIYLTFNMMLQAPRQNPQVQLGRNSDTIAWYYRKIQVLMLVAFLPKLATDLN